MKKFHILLLVIFGFILTPTITYACGIKSEKKCCKKESPAKTDKKKCCSKTEDTDTDEKGCGGSCGDPSCNCPISIVYSLFTFNTIADIQQYIFISISDRSRFNYTEIFVKSVYDALRLPPKIS